MPKNNTDRIIKENLVLQALPVIERILGIAPIKHSTVLPGKLQDTIEREPDFARIVETENDQKFVLHIEFQAGNDRQMLYRMGEYHAIFQKKFGLPVKQFVIYLGDRKPAMRTKLRPEEVFTGFELKNLKNYAAATLTRSDVPEEILMAVLGNFGEQTPEKIIRNIITRLKQVSEDEAKLSKYIYQLTALSRLRKLETTTINEINNMALTYNVKDDFLFKEGVEQGLEKGIQTGKRQVIERLIRLKEFTDEKIAELVDVPLTAVQEVRKGLKS